MYPGVAFTVSDPDVEPVTGGWHNLFGLNVGQSHPFELEFALPEDAVAGSVITIEVVPSGINPQGICCGQHARSVELIIAE